MNQPVLKPTLGLGLFQKLPQFVDFGRQLHDPGVEEGGAVPIAGGGGRGGPQPGLQVPGRWEEIP